MNMIDGANLCASVKIARVNFCDSPNHLFWRVELRTLIKVQLEDFAMDLAIRVLPNIEKKRNSQQQEEKFQGWSYENECPECVRMMSRLQLRRVSSSLTCSWWSIKEHTSRHG